MAENIDLNINIGANVTDLQSQLQKAENLLKQFEAALKKATNVGEINYLNNSIKTLNTQITNLGQQMNKVGRPAADATNALTNLSRVAQDAPYGFIGIANNLNPLLESFQRLSKESGGAGGALKSMVSGLTGPAGIGIALGVVSSVIVAFGDDISNFITDKMQNLGKAFKLESEIITKAGDAYVKAKTDINDLKDSYSDFQNGFITKEKFLKQFNSTLGDTISQTKDLATAEKFLTDYADEYVQMTFKKAVANEAATAAAKKQFEAEVAKNKPNAAFANTFENLFFEGKNLQDLGKLRKDQIIKTADDDVKIFEGIRKKYEDEANKIQEQFKNIFGVVDVNQAPSPVVNYAREENKQLTLELSKMKALREQMKKIGLEPIKLFQLPSEERAKEDKRTGYFQKQSKELLESTQKEGGFGAYMQGIFKKDKNEIDAEAAEKKRIDDLTQSYAQFAQTLSSNVTNALFSMYDAMQQGQNPLEALANAFLQIGKNIAAMVIQALIFEKIMNAFPALKGAFAALGLVGNALSGARVAGSIVNAGNNNPSFNPSGVANNNASQGQFVLKGSDLVLATQRANNNLNIRRGY
jgi:predicted  nucleic acid-binding Zn-ribbon protein